MQRGRRWRACAPCMWARDAVQAPAGRGRTTHVVEQAEGHDGREPQQQHELGTPVGDALLERLEELVPAEALLGERPDEVAGGEEGERAAGGAGGGDDERSEERAIQRAGPEGEDGGRHEEDAGRGIGGDEEDGACRPGAVDLGEDELQARRGWGSVCGVGTIVQVRCWLKEQQFFFQAAAACTQVGGDL